MEIIEVKQARQSRDKQQEEKLLAGGENDSMGKGQDFQETMPLRQGIVEVGSWSFWLIVRKNFLVTCH